MAIAPNDWEFLAEKIMLLYQKVSDEILAEIVRRVEQDIDVPDYLPRKLSDLQSLLIKVRNLIDELESTAFDEVEEMVERAYYSGIYSAEKDISALKIVKTSRIIKEGTNIALVARKTLQTAFSTVDRRAIAAIVAKLHGKMKESHLMILRSTNDIYRQIIGEVSAEAMAGAGTRLQAAQKALNRLADQGISGYRTISGARWEISTYVEMATRSAIGQASIEGHILRQQSYKQLAPDLDLDLVYVSDHPEECEKCRAWEGRILSLSGDHADYPSLQEARDAGLFHPRCGHRLHTYVEGITPKPPSPKPDPAGYEERQYQRYLERQIRFWKKRQITAVTPEARKLANKKVKEWQDKMKTWIEDKDRYRRYERERITGAR